MTLLGLVHSDVNFFCFFVFFPLTEPVRITATTDQLVVFNRTEVSIVLSLFLIAWYLTIGLGVKHNVDLTEFVEAVLVTPQVLHGLERRAIVNFTWRWCSLVIFAHVISSTWHAWIWGRTAFFIAVEKGMRVPHSVDSVVSIKNPGFGLAYVPERERKMTKLFFESWQFLDRLNVILRCITSANRAIKLDCLVTFEVLFGRTFHF